MRKVRTTAAVIFTTGALAASLVACQKNEETPGAGPAEKAGAQIDKAAERAGEHLNKAGETVGQALQKGGQKLEDEAQKAQKKE